MLLQDLVSGTPSTKLFMVHVLRSTSWKFDEANSSLLCPHLEIFTFGAGLWLHIFVSSSLPLEIFDKLLKKWLPLENLTSSGKIDSQEKLTPSGKFDFLGKSWLPWEKLSPSGKVGFLGKYWLPQEKLTFSEKVDSLGKIWLPRENLSPSGKVDPLRKV